MRSCHMGYLDKTTVVNTWPPTMSRKLMTTEYYSLSLPCTIIDCVIFSAISSKNHGIVNSYYSGTNWSRSIDICVKIITTKIYYMLLPDIVYKMASGWTICVFNVPQLEKKCLPYLMYSLTRLPSSFPHVFSEWLIHSLNQSFAVYLKLSQSINQLYLHPFLVHNLIHFLLHPDCQGNWTTRSMTTRPNKIFPI